MKVNKRILKINALKALAKKVVQERPLLSVEQMQVMGNDNMVCTFPEDFGRVPLSPYLSLICQEMLIGLTRSPGVCWVLEEMQK